MSRHGGRRFWGKQDAKAARKAAFDAADAAGPGAGVYGPVKTDDERNEWLEAHGYIVGVSPTGEGMGES